MTGTTINGFQIIEEIGRSESSVVYKAHQVSLDRIVAIKVIPSRFFQGLEEVTRFQQNIQAAARLKYNGIVQVYEAGETGDSRFIASEYIKGYDLAKWIQRDGKLSETNAITIAESIALALGYAWNNSHMTHNNIKPRNILIDEDGTTKVGDLGMTRFSESTAGKAGPVYASNPHYTAPEQFDNSSGTDCRSDIYSLGLLMYHLVTGKIPFEETAPDRIENQQKQGQLDDPRAVVPGISSGFSLLLRKMLAKDRRCRHRDWDELIADLALVKARKKPAKPLPIGPKTTLKNFAGGKTTTASTKTTQAVKPQTAKKQAAGANTQAAEETTGNTPPPVQRGGSPAKMFIIFIVIGIIISAVIAAVVIGAASREKDPRFRKKASGKSVHDFGSGSFAWTNN